MDELQRNQPGEEKNPHKTNDFKLNDTSPLQHGEVRHSQYFRMRYNHHLLEAHDNEAQHYKDDSHFLLKQRASFAINKTKLSENVSAYIHI